MWVKRQYLGLPIFLLSCILLLSVIKPSDAQGTQSDQKQRGIDVLAGSQRETGHNITNTNSPKIDLIGQLGGAATTVAVQGSYAYAGIGPSLVLIDISTPGEPTRVSAVTLPDLVKDVDIVGDYAYVADGKAGLYVVDVSDPVNPVIVGIYETPVVANFGPGFFEGVAVTGNYVYIAGGWSELRVVDVSDPANPTEVGFYLTIGYAYDVAVAEGHAYVAAGWEGVRVVDVRDSANPIEVGFFETPGIANGVSVADGYSYIASGIGGLWVVDVNDPANPIEVGVYDPPGELARAEDVAVAGGYAYVTAQYAGLRVVDVHDPTNPIEAGVYPTTGWARGVAVADGYAYIVDGLGPWVVDVSDPSNPVEVGFYDSLGSAYSVAVSDGYAYVADDLGMRVVDVGDPANSNDLGFYASPGLVDVAVAQNYAYVIDRETGLRVVDVSDPANPIGAGFLEFSDESADGYDVEVTDGFAYIAAGGAGLRVLDVSDPASPIEVGFIKTYGADGVAVADGYAYVVSGMGMRVVDVSDPASPTEVGSYQSPDYPKHSVEAVAVADDYAYVADDLGMRVVDVREPTNPTEVGFYDSPYKIDDVVVEDGYVYTVGQEEMDFRVLEVSDPSSPVEIAFFDTPSEGIVNAVEVVDGYIYIANGEGGLLILDFHPTSFFASGHVLDWEDQPLPGVTVSANPTRTAQTDSSGHYALTGLITGTYTLTPALEGFVFFPPTRTVTVPPNAQSQDFSAVPAEALAIAGKVIQPNRLPFSGVTLAVSPTLTTTTDTEGEYLFPNMPPGTYTVTPSLEGYVFNPDSQTITLPTLQRQAFTVLSAPISVTLTQGVSTTLYFPADAVALTTTLRLTPTLAVPPSGYASAAHAFELAAHRNGELLPEFTFTVPVTTTIHYSLADARVISDTSELALWWWDQEEWREAAQSCAPPFSPTHEVENQVIRVGICTAGRFGLFGPAYQMMLPQVVREQG